MHFHLLRNRYTTLSAVLKNHSDGEPEGRMQRCIQTSGKHIASLDSPPENGVRVFLSLIVRLMCGLQSFYFHLSSSEEKLSIILLERQIKTQTEVLWEKKFLFLRIDSE